MSLSSNILQVFKSALVLAVFATWTPAQTFAQDRPVSSPTPPVCDRDDSSCLVIEENSGLELQDFGIIDFVGISEDSRCPLDVVCFWGGQVKIQLKFQKGTVSEDLSLGLGGNLEAAWLEATSGKQLVLEQVWPEPILSNPVGKPYQIKLRVVESEKDAEAHTDAMGELEQDSAEQIAID